MPPKNTPAPESSQLKPPGRTITPHGYVLVWVGVGHHMAHKRGCAYEHRIVAETKIGRRLLPGEIVHHENEDRQDNRPENLSVVTRFEHKVLHRKSGMLRRLPGEDNPLIVCACGCGTKLLKYDDFGRPRAQALNHKYKNKKAILNRVFEENPGRQFTINSAREHMISLGYAVSYSWTQVTLSELKLEGRIGRVKLNCYVNKDDPSNNEIAK